MKSNCLFCYSPLEEGESDFHHKCSVAFFGTPIPPKIHYALEQIDELAKEIIERSVAVPGVQPKLSLSLVRGVSNKADSRLTLVGALGGGYILKPPSTYFKEMPENEHLTMRMAESYGIPVVPSTLIRLNSGELCYLSKRIDRTENEEKIHMLDMFQITEAFDKYKGSIEKIGRALEYYSSNPLLDKTYLFDLTLFCFITGNNDMHLKNFSMIKTPNGWVLSPAYDLLNVTIIIPEDTEEFALTLGGKKRKLEFTHFYRFGIAIGLTTKQISGSFHRMIKNKPKAIDLVQRSFLSDSMKEAYRTILEERYNKIKPPSNIGD